MTRSSLSMFCLLLWPSAAHAFVAIVPRRCEPSSCSFPTTPAATRHRAVPDDAASGSDGSSSSRRAFMASGAAAAAAATVGPAGRPPRASAVGPVKIALAATAYSAVPCPPERPIPGEKAMVGMKGLCVTVVADLQEPAPKDMDTVGVYGYVTDGDSGDSVLANNPDGGTDAGQFAMIEAVTAGDKTIRFEFIAAVPRDKDLRPYANGIGPLAFASLRLISYPGGQQFGAISPCEMNEFSDECEAWVADNGPYKKAEFMIKSNPRTKGY